MGSEPTPKLDDAERLRERLQTLEREHAEQAARTNEALAAAQDRSYWLDRWHVDLNALMRRRGASELRLAVRAARAVYRALYDARNRVRKQADELSARVTRVRGTVQEERAAALSDAEQVADALVSELPEGQALDWLADLRRVVKPGGRLVLAVDRTSAEWLLAASTPDWHVALFRPGEVPGGGQLVVLERR